MKDNKKSPHTAALILAAGVGSRMGGDVTKQKIKLLGRSVLLRSVMAFDSCSDIDEIIVVGRECELDFIESELCGKINKPYRVVVGGATRAESAARGFLSLESGVDYVAIHDAARCLITSTDISRVLSKAKEAGAATASARVFDTVKTVNSDGRITGNVAREGLIRTQTPQIFRYDWYKDALAFLSGVDPARITDDNMLLALAGRDVYSVNVGEYNLKITEQGDVARAELILSERGDVCV